MLVFGKQIKEIRNNRHLTQQGMADLLDVDRTTISKWENGYSFPNIVDVKTIAEKLEVTLPYLLEGKEEETEKQKKNIQTVKSSESIREYVTFFLLNVFLFATWECGCLYCTAGLYYSFKKKMPLWIKILGFFLWKHSVDTLLYGLNLINLPGIIIIK